MGYWLIIIIIITITLKWYLHNIDICKANKKKQYKGDSKPINISLLFLPLTFLKSFNIKKKDNLVIWFEIIIKL